MSGPRPIARIEPLGRAETAALRQAFAEDAARADRHLAVVFLVVLGALALLATTAFIALAVARVCLQ